jgi:hypothetical protein
VANFSAIASVGVSIERLLNASFAAAFPASATVTTPRALLVRTNDFDPGENTIQTPALSLFLYRVDFNKTMRAAWSAVGHREGRTNLPLDLHFLMTAWGSNAQEEQTILGRTLQTLEATPILTGPLLDDRAGWESSDAIQLVLEEISTEAVMRTFDSLPTDYRLSVPYIARIIRIESDRRPVPVVLDAVTGITASPVP